MIVFDKVTYCYHYEDFDLFKQLSFTLDEEVNTILCGEQGGKSSICKLLCNEISPKSGNVTIFGIQCNANKDNGVLWLPKEPTFFENRTTLFNVAYPLQVRKVAKLQREIIANQLLEQFDLPSNVKVKKLSAEQKRNLAIARGLSVERKVVLLDDVAQDKQQLQHILELFPDAVKVILTSKYSLATGHTVVIDCGECVFEGQPEEAIVKAQEIVSIVKE